MIIEIPSWFVWTCLIPGLILGMIAKAINIYSILKRASDKKDGQDD